VKIEEEVKKVKVQKGKTVKEVKQNRANVENKLK
jgi:hypothetical protein